MADMQNNELTKEKREDIAAAFGVPMTKILSSEAKGLGGGGVSDGDDTRMITDEALPAFRQMAGELNRQLFIPLGYKMVDRANEMDIFKKDEKALSATFINLTSAWVAEPTVAQAMAITLGIEIPKEAQTILDAYAVQAKADKEEAKKQFAEGLKKPTDPKETLRPKRDEDEKAVAIETESVVGTVVEDKFYKNPKADLDIDRWRRKALKNIGKPFEFVSDNIDKETMTAIQEALQTCKDADAVKGVFESCIGTPEPVQEIVPEPVLVKEPEEDKSILVLETAIKAMQDSRQPINVTVNIPEREIKQADINITIPPPNVTVNTPEVSIVNEITDDNKERKDFLKSVRKLADEK
jgi:hypothetical protein